MLPKAPLKYACTVCGLRFKSHRGRGTHHGHKHKDVEIPGSRKQQYNKRKIMKSKRTASRRPREDTSDEDSSGSEDLDTPRPFSAILRSTPPTSNTSRPSSASPRNTPPTSNTLRPSSASPRNTPPTSNTSRPSSASPRNTPPTSNTSRPSSASPRNTPLTTDICLSNDDHSDTGSLKSTTTPIINIDNTDLNSIGLATSTSRPARRRRASRGTFDEWSWHR